MPPRRLPVRVPTIAELNPSPSRTEHLAANSEHIRRKTEHFRPETEHIAPETEHIGRQSGHFRPKTGHIGRQTGHIHCQSGHIGGQIEHLSTQTSAMTPRRAPSAPESPTTSHSPLACRNHIVYTSATTSRRPGVSVLARLHHLPSGHVPPASLDAPPPLRPRPQGTSPTSQPAPSSGNRRSGQKTRQNCLWPARPLRGRAGQRQFPLSSPRMTRMPDFHNVQR